MTDFTAAGIDIGGTNTRVGIAAGDGTIRYTSTLRTRQYDRFDDFILAVFRLMSDLEKQAGETPRMIGIGAPNLNFYSGCIENAANLPWKGILPLKQRMQELSGRPVVTDNDANAAAAGEMLFGKAAGMEDFIQITLGTGIGSGIVADGKIIRGTAGMAGEAGHMIVVPEGRPCGCGRKGCLETYCSVRGIGMNYSEITGRPERKGARELAIMAEHGDLTALEAYRFAGEMLGFALANLAAVTAPQAIILSGGLSRSGPLLFDPALEAFNKNLLHLLDGRTKLMLSGIPAGEAGLCGAAALAMMQPDVPGMRDAD